MAHDVQRPRDKLFRTVFADAAEVAALLRAHLPEALDRWIRFRLLKYCCRRPTRMPSVRWWRSAAGS